MYKAEIKPYQSVTVLSNYILNRIGRLPFDLLVSFGKGIAKNREMYRWLSLNRVSTIDLSDVEVNEFSLIQDIVSYRRNQVRILFSTKT